MPVEETRAPRSERGERAEQRVAEELIAAELAALAEVERSGGPTSTSGILELYRRTGFLDPARLPTLTPRLPAVASTWQRLLGADGDLLKVLLRWAPESTTGRLVPKNSVCAVEQLPGTWQVQHLVSAERHEYWGTLAMLAGVIDWLVEHPGARYARFTWRPANRGTGPIGERIAAEVDPGACSIRELDYAAVAIAGLAPAAERTNAVSLVEVDASAAPRLRRFYAAALPAAELGALGLDDVELAGLSRRYARYGLERSRSAFLAVSGDAVVGAALCNWASEGINSAFFENALDHLVIADDAPPAVRREAFLGLVAAAAEHHARRGRDYLVAFTRPADAELARAAGLFATPPRRYRIAVLHGDEAIRSTRASVVRHYAQLLAPHRGRQASWPATSCPRRRAAPGPVQDRPDPVVALADDPAALAVAATMSSAPSKPGGAGRGREARASG